MTDLDKILVQTLIPSIIAIVLVISVPLGVWK